MILHLDGVGIHFLVLQFVVLSLGCGGTHDNPLGVLSMLHLHAGRVVEGHFFGEALGLLLVGLGCSLLVVLKLGVEDGAWIIQKLAENLIGP